MLSHLTFVAFVVATAAVWRLTHLLVHEAGPAAVLERLRAWPPLAPLLGCFYCCSLWTALPAALWLGQGAADWLLLTLGLSGTAIVVERLSAPALPPAPLWHEAPTDAPAALSAPSPSPSSTPEENPHVLLRP